MLITVPLGVLTTAIVFDILRIATDEPRWADVSFWLIAAGIVGGVIAAVPGLIDWRAIPTGTRARRVGAVHGLGNVLVLALFATSWLLRRPDPPNPSSAAYACAFLGFAVAGVTGWLGGELIERLGVAVHPGANVDAPSSLSAPPPAAASRPSMSGVR